MAVSHVGTVDARDTDRGQSRRDSDCPGSDRGEFPIVILLTGVGTEALFDVARSQGQYDALIEALGRTTVVIRGPKPAAVLNKVGLKYAVRAPEPNTWRELIAAIDESGISLSGQNVAVQEYGLPNARLYAELEQRGANVTAVPVYRWALPEDTTPLENALRETAAGNVNILLFTSANQVSSVLAVAEKLGVLAAIRNAIEQQTQVASIGPTCSEALTDNGFPVNFEASPPKMGQLVRDRLRCGGAEKTHRYLHKFRDMIFTLPLGGSKTSAASFRGGLVRR